MANLIIKIELEDINTSELGNNVIVKCKNNIDLIFTPESIEELIHDYESIIMNKNI